MFKLAKIFLGIFSLLLFNEKVKAGPLEKAVAQNTCYYMDQGADAMSAAKLAGMAQFSLLNSNLVVPGYVRRNMNTIVAYTNANPNAGNEMDTFEFTYEMMQSCFYAIEPYLGNMTGQDRNDLNNCLRDKEWCRKKWKK